MKTVYWAPWYAPQEHHHWNILFDDPKKLLTKVIDDVAGLNDPRFDHMIKCPSFSNLAKNTFYVENPVRSEFKIENGKLIPIGDSHCVSNLSQDANSIQYGLSYIFFCEDDLEMMLTGPYFSETNYTQYGKIICGRFNISKWFRSANLEMYLLKDKDYFVMEENEPMAYFQFLTDEKVVLQRFELNETLRKLSLTCGRVSEWWPKVPLIKRYNKFVSSKTHRLVLREIKKQLVE